VLLGLIMEDTASKHGYLNSGLTAERARAVLASLTGGRRMKALSTTDSIPFSREVRKTFEAATNVSRVWWLGVGVVRPVLQQHRGPRTFNARAKHTRRTAGVQARWRVVHLP
jgi:hypothetical protein